MVKPKRIKKIKHQRKWQKRWYIFLIIAVFLGQFGNGELAKQITKMEREINHLSTVQETSSEWVNIYNHKTGQIMTLPIEDYLIGVVAAEMPASFALEALKAQAVAARTFTYKRLQRGNSQYHLSTDASIDQAWISEDEQRQRWGERYAEYHQKIAQVVTATAGEVVTYAGEIIEPLYHASCGGQYTENAENVWGGVRPYLVSVACHHNDDPNIAVKTVFSLSEVGQRLGLELETLPALAGQKGSLFKISTSSESNRVLEMIVGGKHFAGSQIRSALGLKSTLFSYQFDDDEVIFTTNGYGHGVGLCQYGAESYAHEGYDYRWILQHYYTGTEITLLQMSNV